MTTQSRPVFKNHIEAIASIHQELIKDHINFDVVASTFLEIPRGEVVFADQLLKDKTKGVSGEGYGLLELAKVIYGGLNSEAKRDSFREKSAEILALMPAVEIAVDAATPLTSRYSGK